MKNVFIWIIIELVFLRLKKSFIFLENSRHYNFLHKFSDLTLPITLPFFKTLPKIETRFIRLLESFSRAASVISVPRKSSIGVVKTLKNKWGFHHMFSRKTNISDFSGKKAVWVIKIKILEQKSTFNFANSTADIRQKLWKSHFQN